MALLKLTGLWKGKDKNGEPALSGKLSPITRVIILKNGYKKRDTDPDYFLYLAENNKAKGQGHTGQGEEEEIF